MKKLIFIILAAGVAFCFTGCTKKQQALEEMQQPMSIEDLSRLSAETQNQTAESQQQQIAQAPQSQAQTTPLESLPPSGPYRPSIREIQTALKNASFYLGDIDGKIGPMTKKAITEFQKANNLGADGKVGPKTWAVLSAHLNPVVEQPVMARKKKR